MASSWYTLPRCVAGIHRGSYREVYKFGLHRHLLLLGRVCRKDIRNEHPVTP